MTQALHDQDGITLDLYDRALRACSPDGQLPDRWAVAVSGGADSLALCFLHHAWRCKFGGELVCLTVDHGLRPDAADEAAWVQDTLQTHGISHHILRWTGDKPSGDIQNAAREIRYGLIQKWCKTQGVDDLLLAHHQDDQAETFLLRLARGSGVDGLSGMRPFQQRGPLGLWRPFLNVPKDQLQMFLRNRKQDWIEDPSNHNDAFDRVRFRQAMPILADLGLTPARLAQTATRMQSVRQVLDRLTDVWMAQNVSLFDAGYAEVQITGLFDEDEEIILRGLNRIGRLVGGKTYPARLSRVIRLYESLRRKHDSTLFGCRWQIVGDHILICRELRNLGPAQIFKQGDEIIWDSRYAVQIPVGVDGFADATIDVLGKRGWSSLPREFRDAQSGLPINVIYGLPAIWDKQGVCLVPYLGYKRDGVSLSGDWLDWFRFIRP